MDPGGGKNRNSFEKFPTVQIMAGIPHISPVQYLLVHAEKDPRKVFYTLGNKSFTYEDVAFQVIHRASSLRSSGIRPGDRVAVLLQNPVDYLEMFFACSETGAVFVPLSHRWTPSEYARVENIVRPALVMTDRKNSHSFSAPVGYIDEIHAASGNCQTGEGSFKKESHHTCAILFTSGSTGIPKAVRLSNENFTASALAWHRSLNFTPDDKYLHCLPIYHIGGLSIVTRAVQYGFTLTLHHGFDAERVNHAIDHENITRISLVPTMLTRLLEDRDDHPFPSTLKTILLGGGPIPETLMEQIFRLSIPAFITYGMTETCSGVTGWYPIRSSHLYRKKDGFCAGKPLRSVSLKVINGEIVAAGPMVMQGYLDEPDCKGIHRTGDLGELDEDGYLYLHLRREDRIVTGGENVNPAEVEQVLVQHPMVKECAVVGIPDDLWGQKVVAAWITEEKDSVIPSETNLKKWCRERLSAYKIPQTFLRFDDFPRTDLGKINRAVLIKILTNR